MTDFHNFVLNTNLHEINLLSITLRLVLAVVCGGVIGLTRTELKCRPKNWKGT